MAVPVVMNEKGNRIVTEWEGNGWLAVVGCKDEKGCDTGNDGRGNRIMVVNGKRVSGWQWQQEGDERECGSGSKWEVKWDSGNRWKLVADALVLKGRKNS